MTPYLESSSSMVTRVITGMISSVAFSYLMKFTREQALAALLLSIVLAAFLPKLVRANPPRR